MLSDGRLEPRRWGCEDAIVALSLPERGGAGIPPGWSGVALAAGFVAGPLRGDAARLLGGLDLLVYIGGGTIGDRGLVGGLGVPAYYLPGRLDDPYVVGVMSDVATSVEGRMVYHCCGVSLAGVGGREPLTNIEGLRGAPRRGGVLVLVSAHEPHGFCDLGGLGVRRGLFELSSLARELGAVAHVFPGAEPCAFERRGVVYLSTGPHGSGCTAVLYLGEGGVEGYRVVCSA